MYYILLFLLLSKIQLYQEYHHYIYRLLSGKITIIESINAANTSIMVDKTYFYIFIVVFYIIIFFCKIISLIFYSGFKRNQKFIPIIVLYSNNRFRIAISKCIANFFTNDYIGIIFYTFFKPVCTIIVEEIMYNRICSCNKQ